MNTNVKRSFELFLHKLARHPFLSITVMCVILFFFGFCDVAGIDDMSYVYAGIAVIVIYAALIFLGRIGRGIKENVVILIAASAITITGLMLMRFHDNSPAILLWMFVVILAFICALMYATDNLTERNFVMLMIAAGIMLRFCYTLYTGYRDRQQDVGFFNWKWGHANYIEHWYNNGLKLPDAYQIKIWQYYHPPFHHWMMAILLRFLNNLGMEYIKACEALQVLPLIYSSLIMGICYRIFRFVKLRGLPIVIAMALVCFHPTFVYMGGYFNNDTLCALFMMLSVYMALRWYREPALRRIIPIALSVGLGMMTKLSVWMVAPAIAIIFIYVFVKNIKSWAKYIGQFAVFGLIAAPLGLWYQVRNLIEFDMPITYIPYLNEADPLYCGAIPVSKRLFDFGNGQLGFVYTSLTDPRIGASYDEYNPTVGLIKTSLFGEGTNAINDIHFPQISVTGPILFWLGAILAAVCFVSFIVMMLSKKSLPGIQRVFFSVLAATLLVSYYIFCFTFPFSCTMHIRYCVPLIPLFAMGLGLLLQRLSGNTLPQKIFCYSVYSLTAAFALMTCIVYSQISAPIAV